MKFIQHYSGSKGNLYEVVAQNGDRLMIECGVKWKDIQRAFGYDLSRVVGCLISHEHKDHCRAVKDVELAGIKIWCSAAVELATGAYGWPLPLCAGAFGLSRFEAEHDVLCHSFVVYADGETLFFATDTKCIRQHFKGVMFDLIAIECSYETDLLKARIASGEANETHGLRLLESHQSKAACMDYLDRHCDLSKCRELHLLHLSKDNIADAEALRAEFEQRYLIPTFICNSGKTPQDCTKGDRNDAE